jgi:hypothetical protein
MGGLDRDPGGDPESGLWAAVVERGQGARTATDEEYFVDLDPPQTSLTIGSDEPRGGNHEIHDADDSRCLPG